ncbi:MAG: penicillin-binding protein 1A [Cytophagaceae bacterium]
MIKPKIKLRTYIIFLWSLFSSGMIFFFLYIYFVSINLFGLFGPMPPLEELENPKSNLASEIYTSDHALLGKYFRENRSPVLYNEISPNLINALKATEDYRFEEHSGIDFRSTFRVLFKSILLRKSNAGGGSTISQQLAKNLFRTREKLYRGKISGKAGMAIAKTKEWILAIKIERSYTKEEIITMYLNTVDFGNSAFGIKVAAKTYFKTTPDKLSIPQSALLVGLLKGPNLYNPIVAPDRAVSRRNTVIDQMLKYSFITPNESDSLRKIPLNLDYSVDNHNKGLATYFRSILSGYLHSWCKENGYDLYADGLKIYCTLDSKMQTYAEEAVNDHMKTLQSAFFTHWKGRNPWIDEQGLEIKDYIEKAIKRTERYKALKKKHGDNKAAIKKELEKPVKMKIFTWNGEKETMMSPIDSIKYYRHILHTGFMAMDPKSGHIKAWVGGINHKFFKYDHVKQSKRQPGSTFKPFVYATAIDHGYSPCFKVSDAPVTFTLEGGKTWTPKNSNNKYSGEVFTLRKAMANSVNSITATLMKEVGPEAVVKMAQQLGIESPLSPVPALCLGVSPVSIYELSGAYSTFVNDGVYTKPFFLLRIEDKDGNVIQEFRPERREAINEETANAMVYMLKGATEEEGGTATSLKKFGLLDQGNEIGGKTGTTQNASDGWFVGITPDLVGAVWVGAEDRNIHFRDMVYGQGARMAMPIWAGFMQKLYADKKTGIRKGKFSHGGNINLNCIEDEEDESEEAIINTAL